MSSRDADKFVVRLPENNLRDRIAALAAAEHTSMNSIVIKAIEQYLDGQDRMKSLLDALESASNRGGVA